MPRTSRRELDPCTVNQVGQNFSHVKQLGQDFSRASILGSVVPRYDRLVGYRESRRISRDTYPESHIANNTSIRRQICRSSGEKEPDLRVWGSGLRGSRSGVQGSRSKIKGLGFKVTAGSEPESTWMWTLPILQDYSQAGILGFAAQIRRKTRGCRVQGHLAHKKQRPPRTLQYDYAECPMEALGERAVSYERGTPVGFGE